MFGARAVKSVHMGYSTTQKGYKFFDLIRKLFFVSKDVYFVENIFPFQSSSFLEVDNYRLQQLDEGIVDADPFVVIRDEST